MLGPPFQSLRKKIPESTGVMCSLDIQTLSQGGSEVFREKSAVERYLEIVHSSKRYKSVSEVTVEGILVLSDHFHHLVDVSPFFIVGSSFLIPFDHQVAVSCLF